MFQLNNLIENVKSIGIEENKVPLADIFSFYLRFMVDRDLRGACHDSSVLLYIMFSEYGFNPILNIGVVRNTENVIIDHSWITVDNAIYDIAIHLPMYEGKYISPPIFSSKNTADNTVTTLQFGVDIELDNDAQVILNLTIGEYLQYVGVTELIYNLISQCNNSLSGTYRRPLDMSDIERKYFSQNRQLKKDIQ